jgi:hypothetical protein
VNRQFRIKRLIANVPLVENQFGSQDLPRGYDIETIGMRLAGTLNVTTNFAGAIRAESPVQLVKRIEIIADGKNTLESVRADMANRALLAMRRGQLGLLTPPSASTVAAYPIVASWCIDQSIVDGVRPKDSNLRTSGMQLLQARFTFGQTTDLWTAGAGAGNMSATFVDVWTVELVEIPDASNKVSTKPLYLMKRSYQDIAISASNANLDIPLPIGNVMRGVVFRAEGGTTAGEPDNSTLVGVILRSLTDVRLNMPYLDLREQNKFDYGLTTLPTGICMADLMCNGQEGGVRATEGWDLTKASEAKATLNVVAGAASKVSLATIELIG